MNGPKGSENARLVEASGRFELPLKGKIVLIRDYSESSSDLRKQIEDAVMTIRRNAAPNTVLEFCLGRATPLSPKEDLKTLGPSVPRISLIGPIFEALQSREDIMRIIIVGSGPIWDLEDWVGHPLLEKTLLVSVRESMCGKLKVPKEKSLSEFSANDDLYETVEYVCIFGTGFMPTSWYGQGWELDLADGKPRLKWKGGDTGNVKCELVLSYYIIEREETASVEIRWKHGVVERQKLDSCDILPTTDFEEMSELDNDVANQCINSGRYLCPICGGCHHRDQLECDRPRQKSDAAKARAFIESRFNRGQTVLSILENSRGFILISGNRYRLHPCSVMKIDEGRVARLVNGEYKADIYEYDPLNDQWRPNGDFIVPFQKVGGYYVVPIGKCSRLQGV